MRHSVSALFDQLSVDTSASLYIPAQDGTLLLYKRYDPPPSDKAIASVLLIHGFGEHHGRFLHVVQVLVEAKCVVHVIDLRGHGLSGGARADGRFTSFTNDIEMIHRRVDQEIPCFLYGHSMGGLLVLYYALFVQKYARIDGVIAASPWIKLHKSVQPSFAKRFVLKLVGGMFDEFLLSSNVDPCSLSRRENVASEAIHDRLVLPFLTVRLAKQLLTHAEQLVDHANQFTLPLLMIHGGKDKLTSHAASMEFAELCASKDKTVRLFDNALHEIHNDKDALDLLQQVVDWIHARKDSNVPIQQPVKIKSKGMSWIKWIVVIVVITLIIRRKVNRLIR
jgi:alpha-beta hydrolase superfamily lysophospholipase